MPREKDFKRHVRLRMAGTGERYTRAGEQLRAENRPFNWRLVGDRPEAYQLAVEVDERVPGRQVHVLSCTGEAGGGFGALSASLRAEHHRGQRVRFAASLRGEGVTSWAGLWMRIDAAPGTILAFDNMQDRPLRGTFDWGQFEIVLDVPPEAETITLGVLLVQGAGRVLIADAQLTATGTGVSPTQPAQPGGWMLGGTARDAYEVAVEPGPVDGVTVLRSTTEPGEGSGFIGRSEAATTYRGRRLRIRGSLRGEDVSVSAGLAVYITDARGETVAFDDMWDRPLQGTFGWAPAAIVLDVPEQAAGISYGVVLIGSGAVGVSDVRLEMVDDDTPVTTRRMAAGWALNSDNPDLYEVEDEPYERSPGERQALLRSTTAAQEDNGALTRWTTTGEQRGKLVRFTAALRGEDVESGTGLWISSTANQPTEEGLATDSQEPMLQGTFGWREEAVMVAIPEDAAGVVYGVTMSGRGAVYVAQPRLEIVNE